MLFKRLALIAVVENFSIFTNKAIQPITNIYLVEERIQVFLSPDPTAMWEPSP
jgi:hypothetical protein